MVTTEKIDGFEQIYNFRTLIYYGKTMVLWKKLWFYNKIQLTIVNCSLIQYFLLGTVQGLYIFTVGNANGMLRYRK